MSDNIIVINESVPSLGVFAEGTAAAGPKGDKGDTGATGAAGLSIRSGTTAPSNAVGVNGEFYINTSTNMIYGPKAAGAWPAGKSLVGPQGSQGAQGIQGERGLQGPAGTVSNIPYGGSGSSTSVSRADHDHLNTEKIVAGGTGYIGTKPTSAAWIRQMGTHVGSLSAASVLTIPLPQAFPNGIVTAVVCPGDNAGNIGSCILDITYTTKSSLHVPCYQRNGTNIAGGTLVRVNYTVLGW